MDRTKLAAAHPTRTVNGQDARSVIRHSNAVVKKPPHKPRLRSTASVAREGPLTAHDHVLNSPADDRKADRDSMRCPAAHLRVDARRVSPNRTHPCSGHDEGLHVCTCRPSGRIRRAG